MSSSYAFRHLTAAIAARKSSLLKFHSTSCAFASLSFTPTPQEIQHNIYCNDDNKKSDRNKTSSYFPKRGQELELVCENLAFKGKGICKVEETGFVVMCDRVLPGEKFIGRVTRKTRNYAEVTKVKTISPHWDSMEAPCEYAPYCGGCKTQNLSYEAQLRAKEQQVRDLVIHVGKFSDKDPEFFGAMKSIVPCDIQFHYRNRWNSHLVLKDGFLKNYYVKKEIMRIIMHWDYMLLDFFIRF